MALAVADLPGKTLSKGDAVLCFVILADRLAMGARRRLEGNDRIGRVVRGRGGVGIKWDNVRVRRRIAVPVRIGADPVCRRLVLLRLSMKRRRRKRRPQQRHHEACAGPEAMFDPKREGHEISPSASYIFLKAPQSHSPDRRTFRSVAARGTHCEPQNRRTAFAAMRSERVPEKWIPVFG
jgi:hypothetical protein